MDVKMQEMQQTMEGILQEDYLRFALQSFQIEEQESGQGSKVLAKISRSDNKRIPLLEGGGVGAFHAFFVALRDRFSEEFPSVKGIIFSSIKAQSVPGSDQEHPTDAETEVAMGIQNSYGDHFEFTTKSRSLLRASLEGILLSFEYFVNSEQAYIRCYKAINYYKEEQQRPELVDKYTSLLGMMVRNTSYTEVIDEIK